MSTSAAAGVHNVMWLLHSAERVTPEVVAAAFGGVVGVLDVLGLGDRDPVVRFGVDRRDDVAVVPLGVDAVEELAVTWRRLAAESRNAVSADLAASGPLRIGLSEARSKGRSVDTRFFGGLYDAGGINEAQCDAVVDVVASVAGVGSPVQAFVGVEQARLAMMNAGLAHLPSEEARTFGYMWLVGLRPVEMEALGGVEAFSEVYPGSVVETGGLGMPWLARMGPTPWVSQEVLEEARVALAPCLVRTERSVRGAMHRAREVYDDSRQGRWLAEADRRLVREWAAAGD